ncbi:hypothetical protein EIN_372040 [Entamoeba invadens IP1]|uniref:Peptidase S74 domain-containing protein n=1 Tax=Entamoeba invadens IP1 TaxID=370355 RepID=A0A0A1UGL3_ENTIV|nr:hypothetical protein EIN_372040 [Entamoeba invadens IP1]ELP92782.1 hypothetical protein EIN_372040 [Entamoeba invadens IP1]|eukprot:XP_004259553.1 hypothetical protein EIN_372040 [Entamoeba invadens IP1]
MDTTKRQQATKEDSKRNRFKEHICTFPGCTENPKTKYNVISHIWDVHLRHTVHTTDENLPFKSIKDKKKIEELCKPYIGFVESSDRKRRPYDFADMKKDDASFVQNNTSVNIYSDQMQDTFQSFLPQDQYAFTEQLGSPSHVLNTSSVSGDTNAIAVQQHSLPTSPQTIPVQLNIESTPFSDKLIANNENIMTVYNINEQVKRLHVFGEVFAENGFLQRSDRRFKTNIKPIRNALQTIDKLFGVSFNYLNDKKSTHFGFIAQEVREVIPEAVIETEDGTLSIEPLAFIPFVIESIKILKRELNNIQTQTTEVVVLSKTVTKLSTSLVELDKGMKEADKYSLGPFWYTFGLAVMCGVLSIPVAIHGNFPYIFFYLLIIGILHGVSAKEFPCGTWNDFSMKSSIVLLGLGLICLVLTFLEGSFQQIFLLVFSVVTVSLLFFLRSTQTLASAFSVVFPIFCVLSVGLLQYQNSVLSHNTNVLNIEQLAYQIQQYVQPKLLLPEQSSDDSSSSSSSGFYLSSEETINDETLGICEDPDKADPIPEWLQKCQIDDRLGKLEIPKTVETKSEL